ncbi:YaaC family protein [Salimicrobium sp. PL1-032A]|uniref:YaaC family protein n=1 Tax=Salimicrobium sp. PL1-032A TaxID=3095364 RepID=UPI003260AD0A
MTKNLRYIATDNPETELWRIISKYSYPSNIEKYFNENDIILEDEKVVDFISGSILQAESYFRMAKTSELYIKPLLVYYGVSNLLAGTSSLLTGSFLAVKNHGMNLIPPTDLQEGIISSQVKIVDPGSGGFTKFHNILVTGETPPHGITIGLNEVLGSIPDLKFEFENCYQAEKSNVIPVEIVKLNDRTIERIYYEGISRVGSKEKVFNNIEHFKDNYLPPQFLEDKIVLNRKMNFNDIGIYSIHGRKYLQLSIQKKSTKIKMNSLFNMYLALYALGYLSRYNPHIWNPFVQKDLTGEKLVIEKFMDIAIRHVPNLVLNIIEGEEIKFMAQTDAITDLRNSTLDKSITKLVEEQVKKILHSEGRGGK